MILLVWESYNGMGMRSASKRSLKLRFSKLCTPKLLSDNQPSILLKKTTGSNNAVSTFQRPNHNSGLLFLAPATESV